MSKDWLLEGKPYNPDYEDIPEEYVGFIYRITDNETGEMYIGQKRFHKTKTLPITKTRKRRVRTRVESDWRDYYGSSRVLQERSSQGHTQTLVREIIRFGYSKGDLSYLEAEEQIKERVLFRDDYLNGVVNMRVHQKHISNRLKEELGYAEDK